VLERTLGSPPPGAGALAEVGAWALALPHRDDRRARLTAFLFPTQGSSRRPAADRVVKLRREGVAGPGLAAEGETLARLARELPEELAGTVPALLGSGRTPGRLPSPMPGGTPKGAGQAPAGWELLVLSALPGRSAYVELQGSFVPSRRAPGHLEAAVRWLEGFQQATARSGARWPLPPWEELDPGPVEEAAAGGRRRDWHRRLEERLAAFPLAPVAVHGDFWARNLLAGRRTGIGAGSGPVTDPDTGGRGTGGLRRLPGVVDWEHFRPDGPPFQDLFTFTTTYALSFPWGGRRRPAPEALERAFLRESSLSRALRDAFRRYARAMGVDGETLEGLFRVFLLERVRRGAGGAVPGAPGARGEAPGPSTKRSNGAPGSGPPRGAWLGLYRRLEGGERSVFSG
ncbi:MAG: phosphotransferase family protein, partial [Thermoanaerobaculia bacterium]